MCASVHILSPISMQDSSQTVNGPVSISKSTYTACILGIHEGFLEIEYNSISCYIHSIKLNIIKFIEKFGTQHLNLNTYLSKLEERSKFNQIVICTCNCLTDVYIEMSTLLYVQNLAPNNNK